MLPNHATGIPKPSHTFPNSHNFPETLWKFGVLRNISKRNSGKTTNKKCHPTIPGSTKLTQGAVQYKVPPPPPCLKLEIWTWLTAGTKCHKIVIIWQKTTALYIIAIIKCKKFKLFHSKHVSEPPGGGVSKPPFFRWFTTPCKSPIAITKAKCTRICVALLWGVGLVLYHFWGPRGMI